MTVMEIGPTSCPSCGSERKPRHTTEEDAIHFAGPSATAVVDWWRRNPLICEECGSGGSYTDFEGGP